MRLIFIFVIILALFSCQPPKCGDDGIACKIEVTYKNGDKTVFTGMWRTKYVWLEDEGCLMADHDRLACDVRSYKLYK